MGENKVQTKAVRYWKEVFSRAIASAVRRSGMEPALAVAIVVLVAVLVGVGLNFLLGDALRAFILTVILFALLVVLGVYRIPVEMHDERGGFNDGYFKLVARPWYMNTDKNAPHTVSITVLNKTLGVINNCLLTVDEMTDAEGGDIGFNKQVKLCWSAGQKAGSSGRVCQEIDHATRSLIIDVATTEPDNTVATFLSWNPWTVSFPKGRYRLLVTAQGVFGDKRVSRSDYFILDYFGTNKILINADGDNYNRIPNPDYLEAPPMVDIGTTS